MSPPRNVRPVKSFGNAVAGYDVVITVNGVPLKDWRGTDTKTPHPLASSVPTRSNANDAAHLP